MIQLGNLNSMTGFGRAEGSDSSYTWNWELKSVNGRTLDMRCRLPFGWESLEQRLRGKITERCRRGNFQIALSLRALPGAAGVQVNRGLLDELASVVRELRGADHEVDVESLLAIRGVVEPREEEDVQAREERESALLTSFAAALEELRKARAEEGAKLGRLIQDFLSEIQRLKTAATEVAATQPAALRDRLISQLEELMESNPPLSEERLAQESALLANKADVREELDRLQAHCDAASALLKEGGAIGRKLDFLCQEFNREANSLCSKSSDIELTRLGLDLKSQIEQMREQVQNLE